MLTHRQLHHALGHDQRQGPLLLAALAPDVHFELRAAISPKVETANGTNRSTMSRLLFKPAEVPVSVFS